MEKKLQEFLDKAFASYGDFPAREDVVQELLANLQEKVNDLKAQDKSDDEAYQAAVDSFGDVSEIMAEVPHEESRRERHEREPSLYRTIVDGIKEATGNTSTVKASVLTQADLADMNLAGKDFSMSAMTKTSFDRSNLSGVKFRAAALHGASFIGANLTKAVFSSSDLQNVHFDKANMTAANLNACALDGATFTDATLNETQIKQSDLSNVSFEGMILKNVQFNSSSLKKTSFKNAVLRDVSFHHAAVKHANFDGATMDKLTYALLKGAKATLDNVIIQ